jgi:hypothetical protein
MHERLRDTAMGMRSTDKALELSDRIAQGTTVLQSLQGKDKAIEEGRKFFSALDVMGKNIDPKEVKELFNSRRFRSKAPTWTSAACCRWRASRAPPAACCRTGS